MFKAFKSEVLKLKHSFTLYLISGVFVVELLTVPAYLAISRNVYATQAAIYFPVMGYCLLLSIVALQTFEQEEKANHWQNVNCTQKRLKLWISKLVTIDFLLFLPSVLLWQLIGVVVNKTIYANYVGFVTWLLLIFLNHFHHLLLTIFSSRNLTIIVAFVECLFILFASNGVFANYFWIPIVLPVNAILAYGNSRATQIIWALIGWIVVCVIFNVITLKIPKTHS